MSTNNDKTEFTPAARIIWTFLASTIGVIAAILLAALFLDTGLDAAAIYGVPEASYGRCADMVVGIWGVSWAWWLGQPRKSREDGTTVAIINQSDKR